MNRFTDPLHYASVCSGIEAVTLAWRPLGLAPAWFSEIDPFANAVLAHHYPTVPNVGDMARIAPQILSGAVCAPDILVGGTPCQAFSVAGMRQGLADPRGTLTLKYAELANAIDQTRRKKSQPPCVVVWENVPGVLSDRANAFGHFLGAITGEDRDLHPPGEKWTNAGCIYGPERTAAWRVFDAQYFGVAQRRRRVFLVASARHDFDPASVLFESESLRRDSPPSSQAWQSSTGTAASGTADPGRHATAAYGQTSLSVCFGGGSTRGPIDRAACLISGRRIDFECETFAVQAITGSVSHALNTANNGKGSSEDGSGRGVPIIAVNGKLTDCKWPSDHMPVTIAFAENSRGELRLEGGDGQRVGVLSAGGGKPGQGLPMVASVSLRGRQQGVAAELGDNLSPALRASSGGGDKAHVLAPSIDAHFQCIPSSRHDSWSAWRIRRLMPLECERLQGLPDNYTLVSYRGALAADGPRYKAIGNSMAVPCVHWIGQRLVAALARERLARAGRCLNVRS